MRFASYEHQHRHRVAVVEEDGTLYPLPGVTSLTALLKEADGLPGLLAAGATALDVPPGPHVSRVRLLPPLQPSSVRDFVTFEEHVEGVRRAVDGAAGCSRAVVRGTDLLLHQPARGPRPARPGSDAPRIVGARLRTGGGRGDRPRGT